MSALACPTHAQPDLDIRQDKEAFISLLHILSLQTSASDMKTPERWQHSLTLSVFLPHRHRLSNTHFSRDRHRPHDLTLTFLPKMSNDAMTITPCRHVTSSENVMWHHMIWQNGYTQVNPSETMKTTFFNLAALTFDLWPWPSNSSKISSMRLC